MQYNPPEHEKFFTISMNQLSPEFTKLHTKITSNDISVADKFPTTIETNLPSISWTLEDREAVVDIAKILIATAGRVSITSGKPPPQTGKKKPQQPRTLTDSEQADIMHASGDLMGRILPELSLSDIAKHPCLAILYRHGLSWQTAEAGNKTGKLNGFLSYAYLAYVGWRVYGDTIGRMTRLNRYLSLRTSLFSFLGKHCHRTLDDFFNRSGDPPACRMYANWDHKLLDKFVDCHGHSIDDKQKKKKNKQRMRSADGDDADAPAQTGKASEGSGGKNHAQDGMKATTKDTVQPSVTFSSASVKFFDPSRMVLHTANVKKVMDAIGRTGLALGPTVDSSTSTTAKQRSGAWSPDVALHARKVALVCYIYICFSIAHAFSHLQALMRNALEAESRDLAENKKGPYVDISDEDLEHFLPPLPAIGKRSSNTYASLEEFKDKDPGRYLVYCHGLVEEGYESPPCDDESEENDDTAQSVHRQTMRPSGTVYPQDMNWAAKWASVKSARLDATSLPDPVAEQLAEDVEMARTVPQPRARLQDARAAQEDRHAAKNATVAKGSQAPSVPPPEGTREPAPARNTGRAKPSAPAATAANPRKNTNSPRDAPSLSTTPVPLPSLSGFKVQPKPRRPTNVDPSEVNDPMDVDPGVTPAGPLTTPKSAPRIDDHMEIETVPAQSSTALTAPPDDRMETDPVDPRGTPGSSSVNDVPPDASPDNTPFVPLPIQVPVVLRGTRTRSLKAPTDEEVTAFEALVAKCDPEGFTVVFEAAFKHTRADPDVGLAEDGEPPDVMQFYRTVWAVVRDTKGETMPDEVFEYVREDHPDVSQDLPMADAEYVYLNSGVGGSFVEGSIARFKKRAEAAMAPIYEVVKTRKPAQLAGEDNEGGAAHEDRGNIFKIKWQKIVHSNLYPASEQQTKGKRRQRSNSMLEEIHMEGGASPPKTKHKRSEESSGEEQSDPPRTFTARRDRGSGASKPGSSKPGSSRPGSSTAAARGRSMAPPSATTRSAAKKARENALPEVEEEDGPEQHADPPPRGAARHAGQRMGGKLFPTS